MNSSVGSEVDSVLNMSDPGVDDGSIGILAENNYMENM